ncbi:15-hydroxyprostaglandin dehydrogenase [Ilyonectria robusta]
MSYTGETAYITGGASGIGRSLAARLVSKGMKVFIADRNIQGAQEVAKQLNKNGQVAWAVQVDVADWESQKNGFEAAVKEFSRIDYVFPVAGIPESSWLPNRPNATTFEKPNLAVFDVNGTGALYSCALAIQQFRRQTPNKYGYRGKVVPVASGCGFYYITTLPIYTASKHAIVGFVRSFGKHLPEEKITLNAICPNIVKTSISTGDFYDRAGEKGLLITEDSLVAAFESLLGASDISGEAIEVLPGDGGWRIKEIPEYTNEKCRMSVEMTRDRSHRSHKFHEPVAE